jgi:hypothetical protein
MLNISKYIILISLLFAFFAANAQEQAGESKKDTLETPNTPKIPKAAWLHGIRVEVDAAAIARSAFSRETYSFEGAVQANILQKYLPVIEIGFAGANHVSTSNVTFKTAGFFGRAGLDFKLLKQKPDEVPIPHLLIAGVRLGMSPVTYDISNITVTDTYWDETQIFDFKNNKEFKMWFEGVAGVRVEILKNIFMGFSVRFKGKFKETPKGPIQPWYIPGYGINGGSHWDFNYSIGYCF